MKIANPQVPEPAIRIPTRQIATSPDPESLKPLLLKLGAGRLKHSGERTFAEHLEGTQAILKAWGAKVHVQVAGLFHSIYATEHFDRQLIPVSQRHSVEVLIGTKAEHLVYLFAKIKREDLRSQILNLSSDATAHTDLPIAAIDASPGNDSLTVTIHEAFDLCMLVMANDAEQASDAYGAPGCWLASTFAMAAALSRHQIRIPLALVPPTPALSPEDELGLRDDYMNAISSMDSDLMRAKSVLQKCASVLPLGEVSLWLSFIAWKEADCELSMTLATRARARFEQWGTAWDKRLRYQEWLWVCEQLEFGAREHCERAQIVLFRMLSPDVLSTIQARDTGSIEKPTDRLRLYLDSFQRNDRDTRMMTYPGLSSQTFLDELQFPIVSALHENYEAIRREIEGLDAGAFSDENEPIERNGSWTVLFLHERGRRNAPNAMKLPTLSRIVDAYDNMRTFSGGVYISRMAPNTVVAAHCGPTNIRVRCHLAIDIPEGDCGIRCGQEQRNWREGRCLVFNDAVEHEVWNHTERPRTVVIIDLWHPQLTCSERHMLIGLHNYVFEHARTLHYHWAKAGVNGIKPEIGDD